jgi:hypothetical protein
MAITIKAKKLEDVRPGVPVHEVVKEDSVRLNLNIAPSLRRTWKQAGLDRNMTMTDMIEAAMADYLKKTM